MKARDAYLLKCYAKETRIFTKEWQDWIYFPTPSPAPWLIGYVFSEEIGVNILLKKKRKSTRSYLFNNLLKWLEMFASSLWRKKRIDWSNGLQSTTVKTNSKSFPDGREWGELGSSNKSYRIILELEKSNDVIWIVSISGFVDSQFSDVSCI